jgi:hypothetical protein
MVPTKGAIPTSPFVSQHERDGSDRPGLLIQDEELSHGQD